MKFDLKTIALGIIILIVLLCSIGLFVDKLESGHFTTNMSFVITAITAITGVSNMVKGFVVGKEVEKGIDAEKAQSRGIGL